MSTVLPSSALAFDEVWPAAVAPPEDLSPVDEQPVTARAAHKTVSFSSAARVLVFMVCSSGCWIGPRLRSVSRKVTGKNWVGLIAIELATVHALVWCLTHCFH